MKTLLLRWEGVVGYTLVYVRAKDERLTLETSAFKLFMMANLRYQLT